MLNPVLLDVPESFETERLLLRVVRPGDGPAFHEAVVESLAELRPWLAWISPDFTAQQAEERCRTRYSEFLTRTAIALSVLQKQTGALVGRVGLIPHDWTIPSFSIGYWCRTRFVGQGYISEAVREVLRFGFELLSAKRIEIRCDSKNNRSIRVAERVGALREGELKNYFVDSAGSLRDDVVFALTDEDWRQTPAVLSR